ncbi:hypothetical protein VCHC19A1_0665, partial [Vibrio cholerae HC-19A1]|jgi:hypothetical protein
MLI